jgi:threonine dehydrogenase-like Zn-dependent dehydrogenase
MKAAVYNGKRDIRIEDVPDARVQLATDAVVRITHAAICGSDLWYFRGYDDFHPGWRTGHEWMGVIEDVGPDVRTLSRGDYVVAPFAFSDGSCELCEAGIHTSCRHGGFWARERDGGHGEAIAAPFADATLLKIPKSHANDLNLLRACLPLTDVMGTGHHAAVCAYVASGRTVAVIGDGAVGLCAVLASRRLGAERIIILGRHAQRLKIAREFGATDIVSVRGEDALEQVRALTGGHGPHSVLECVGSEESMNQAINLARPGGAIGYVGAPHESSTVNVRRLFMHNIGLRGGVAPVRAYLPELLSDVLAGRLDPSPVLDSVVDLAGLPEGYAAMDERRATKVMIRG